MPGLPGFFSGVGMDFIRYVCSSVLVAFFGAVALAGLFFFLAIVSFALAVGIRGVLGL